MSTLYVDTITEKTAGNGVQIPGHVIKQTLVDVTPASNVQVTSSTFVEAFSATYTPQTTTSTILVDISFIARSQRSGGADGRWQYRVKVDGTKEFGVISFGTYDYGGNGIWNKAEQHNALQIDNTTGNSTTVSVEIATNGGSDVYVYSAANDEGRATIKFTEIAQ